MGFHSTERLQYPSGLHSRLGLRRPSSEEKRKTTPIVDGVAVKGSESESQKLLSGAAVVGQDNAADPPLASSGQQCETDHLGAKPATAGTAGMQGGLEDTFFDRVDSADTIDNQDADSDIDGIQVAMRRTGLIRSGINFRRKGCALWVTKPIKAGSSSCPKW
ncbi:hypothetical protein CABS01_16701 [Colletotrichum abscissum]|uniref:uncharacterized protein n=1 Tax=Colletotrichum abscissum TaxID=1671311 RepID=UPI0027D646D4|nr:uncharacterized protein CABS01_16701 [Colletotrichum abscissum]KAK1515424.1 hypothetical protein CABS01_16701 [Colletotrichum abscissum]